MKTNKENRQNTRLRIFSLIKYTTSPGASPLVANIQDLSFGGLAFLADEEIRPGTVLNLYFLPPNREKPVEAHGKVVRCSEIADENKTFKIGVQFLDVSGEAKLAIKELEAFFLKDQRKSRP